MRLIAIISLLLLMSCEKDILGPQQEGLVDEYTSSPNAEVFVLNEGNFGWGNASIDVYNKLDHTLQSGVFKAVNGFGLGDVAQSIQLINDSYWISMNNSGKVYVLDTASLELVNTISGLNSPRYTCLANSKIYISDLYANKVWVHHLSSASAISSVNVGGWTEHMLALSNDILAVMPDSGSIQVIDAATDQIKQTIKLSKGVGKLRVDQNGFIWALCSGGSNQEIPRLYKIDPSGYTIADEWTFPISDSPSLLCINGSGDRLYYYNDGIFEFPISSASLPTATAYHTGSKIIYGLDVDPDNGDIYVSDVKDYVQKSEITRLSSSFQVIDQFEAGIITNGFLFD